MAAHGVTAGRLGRRRAKPAHSKPCSVRRSPAHEIITTGAEAGIPLLADDGSQFTVWLMRHVYAGILEEVERLDYQVLHRRASTSLPRKLLLAGACVA